MPVYNPYPKYVNFTDFTPVVPELYWNVYSSEERIKALCMEWVKLTAYVDGISDTINDQYAIIKDMQERLPELVSEDVYEELQALIESGAFDEILERVATEYWEQYESRIVAVESDVSTLNTNLGLERDARIAEDASIRSDFAQDLADEVSEINDTITTEVNRLDSQDELLDDRIAVLEAPKPETFFDGLVHITEGKSDTSYFIVKMPRDYVELELHNLSGSDADPKVLNGNAYSYAKNNDTVFVATNANYGGNDYPMRFNGINISGTDLSRPYLGFDENMNPTWFPIGTDISSIPNTIVTAYACDAYLVVNGNINTGIDTEINEPRNVFGWDDDNYYILICDGRGTMQHGLTLFECAQIMHDYGVENAVNLDGGGSTCFAVNNETGTHKVNKYRDFSLPFNDLRSTGIGHIYKLKNSAPNTSLNKIVNSYRNGSDGYTGYKNYVIHYGTSNVEALDTTLNARNIPTSGQRNVGIFNQFLFSSNYVFPGKFQIPIPIKRYANESIYVHADLDLQIPANSVTQQATIAVNIARYTDGVRAEARRRRITVPVSTTEQRISLSEDVMFMLNKTGHTAEMEQEEFALEISVVGGAMTTLNFINGFMSVDFEAPIV